MKRRNNRQTGFTLVECIAALVVMSVLAVLLVPALTRYIDEGREKQAVSEAQICVTSATEWAAKQRAALVAKAYAANKPFNEAYADANNAALRWSANYADLAAAAPTVTGGTVALTEGDGQYVLRPDTTPNGTADDAMKAAVKAAAEVNGSVTAMQLNADGKVLYLLYTAANGTTVAYTAADTAKDPATTVPVATLPENKKPDTSGGETGGITPTPSHSGDLVFCVLDEYSNQPVQGIAFHVIKFNNGTDGEEIFSSQTTDANGMVYFNLDPATLTYYQQFKLVPDNWPEGYQQVFDVTFNIVASDKNNDGSYDSYEMQSNPVNTNHNYNYKDGTVGKLTDGADMHLYTFYVRPVPTLELRVLDKDTGNYVENVNFTLSKDGKSIPITSGSSPTMLDVKLHEKDNLRPGRESYCLDMSHYWDYARFLVTFTDFPTGYQYFDNCYLEIKLENQPEHNWQLSTEFQKGQTVGGKQSRTDIECKDFPDKNKSVVTIHVILAA